jgi:hypothetical protein
MGCADGGGAVRLKGRAKAEPGRLEFEDGAHHQVKLPLSFKGLPAALAAREEHAQ